MNVGGEYDDIRGADRRDGSVAQAETLEQRMLRQEFGGVVCFFDHFDSGFEEPTNQCALTARKIREIAYLA